MDLLSLEKSCRAVGRLRVSGFRLVLREKSDVHPLMRQYDMIFLLRARRQRKTCGTFRTLASAASNEGHDRVVLAQDPVAPAGGIHPRGQT